MSDDHQCSCGGCGTGTPCCHNTNSTQAGVLDGIYAYAAPPVHEQETTKPLEIFTGTATEMEQMMRATLDQEMLKDLLQRVQQLEKTAESLTAELQQLNSGADTSETKRDEGFDQATHTFDRIFTSLSEFLQYWDERNKK